MSSTGYGPRSDSRWKRLTFNGDENDYELWEAKFLGHLRMLKLKTTILPSEDPPDEAKNEECYAEQKPIRVETCNARSQLPNIQCELIG